MFELLNQMLAREALNFYLTEEGLVITPETAIMDHPLVWTYQITDLLISLDHSWGRERRS